MRWVNLFLILLLAFVPAVAQDGGDDESGIEEDSKPEGPEEPEPRKEPGKPGSRRPPPPVEEYPAPTPENINRAIDRGVAWLKKAQNEDGSWGPCVSAYRYGQPDAQKDEECYESGPTTFAIFTLAKCDVPERDKTIKAGLKWLHKFCRQDFYTTGRDGDHRMATYESASVILMLTALYAPAQVRHPSDNPAKRPAGSKFKDDDWAWMHERISHLCVGWQRPTGGGKMKGCQNRGGGWRYYESSGDQDASATQFVLLALREAVRAGYPLNAVAPDVWKDAAEGARSFQLGSGGFRYQKDYPWSAGMTAASVASLLICKEQMLLAKEPVPAWLDGSVESGLKFLGEVFDVEQNRGEEGSKETGAYHYYHLYGLERAGVLSNKKEFGGKAWYARGASFLLSRQEESGRWEDETCMRPKDVLGTCFALLFLKRATPPPAVTVTGD